jgi:phage gp36-like protein
VQSLITPSDVTSLAIPAGAVANVSPTDQQNACDAASATVLGYFAARYALPLLTWGLDVRLHASLIAAYNMMAKRGFNPAGADEQIRERYMDAIYWLRDVSNGRVTPDVTSTQPAADPMADVVSDPSRGW